MHGVRQVVHRVVRQAVPNIQNPLAGKRALTTTTFYPIEGVVTCHPLQRPKVADFLKTNAPDTKLVELHHEISRLQENSFGQLRHGSDPNRILKSVASKIIQSDPVYQAVQQFDSTTRFDDHMAVRYPNKETAMSVIRQLVGSAQFQYPGIHVSNDAKGFRLPVLDISILDAKQHATFLVSTEAQAPIKRIFISWLNKSGPNMAPSLTGSLPKDLHAASESEEKYLTPAQALSEKFGSVLAPNHLAIDISKDFSDIDYYCLQLERSSSDVVVNKQTNLNVDDPDLNQRALIASDSKTGLYLEIVLRHKLDNLPIQTIGFANPTTVANIGSSSAATR